MTSTFMKLKWFLVTVIWLFLLTLASAKDKNSVVVYAIHSIMNEHFATPSATSQGRIDVAWFGKGFPKLVEKLLKIKNTTTAIKFFRVIALNDTFYLPNSVIAIFDSVDRFKANAHYIKRATNREQRTHHLVYVPKLKYSDIINTFPAGFLIDHVSFLMNKTENSIECVTAFMFSPFFTCRQLQLETINRFDLNTLKWENAPLLFLCIFF